MLYPVAQIMKNPRQREGIVFYDSEKGKTVFWKLKDIKKATAEDNCKMVGVFCSNSMLRMYKYYKKIGTVGEESEESYTIFQKTFSKENGITYTLVDTFGNLSTATREDILQLFKSGVKINGALLHPDGTLSFSSSIETKILGKEEVLVEENG